jgi:hypothetical protein
MSVKLVILKSEEMLIADAKEVVSEGTVRGILLSKPHTINTLEKTVLTEGDSGNSNYEIDISLKPWLILSKDDEFIVSSDYVATVCEPIISVKEMYLNKIGGTMEVKEEEDTPLSPTEVING